MKANLYPQEFLQIVKKRRSVRVYDKNAKFDSNAVTRSLELATLSPNSSNLQLWEFYHIKSKEAKETIAEYCLGQPAATTANELVVFVTRRDKWKQRTEWNLNTVLQSLKGKQQNVAEQNDKAKNTFQKFNQSTEERIKAVKTYYNKLIPMLYKTDPVGFMSFGKQVYTFFQAMKKPSYREVKNSDLRVVSHKSCALAAQTFMLSMTAEGYGTCPMEGFDSKRIKQFLKLPSQAEICMVISCGVAKPEGIYGKQYRVPNQEVIKVI